MKIIDLLNMISKGEKVPKKIKYDGSIYKFNNLQDDYMTNDNYEGLLDELCTFSALNDEIEIIEKPKNIKKLDENNTNVLTNIIENRKKINEIIDHINKGDE